MVASVYNGCTRDESGVTPGLTIDPCTKLLGGPVQRSAVVGFGAMTWLDSSPVAESGPLALAGTSGGLCGEMDSLAAAGVCEGMASPGAAGGGCVSLATTGFWVDLFRERHVPMLATLRRF